MTKLSDRLQASVSATMALADELSDAMSTPLERRFKELNTEALSAQNGIRVLRHYLDAFPKKPDELEAWLMLGQLGWIANKLHQDIDRLLDLSDPVCEPLREVQP